MALTDIDAVRLLTGDVLGSPFYQMLTDEQIQYFLDINGGNVRQAARMAAISISMQLAGYSSRERTGDIEVWSNLSTAYLKALDNLIDDKTPGNLPNGMMPYASGISWADVCANNANSDSVRSPLTQIKVCDCGNTPCGCNSSLSTNPFKSCGC